MLVLSGPDLESALANVKKNKSRDPEGLINELLKPDVIGLNLKNSIFLMSYRCRRQF